MHCLRPLHEYHDEQADQSFLIQWCRDTLPGSWDDVLMAHIVHVLYMHLRSKSHPASHPAEEQRLFLPKGVCVCVCAA